MTTFFFDEWVHTCPGSHALTPYSLEGAPKKICRAWLLDERAWLQSQAFFLLGQGTTEIALHRFQYLAFLVVEQLSRGFAFWREWRRWLCRCKHGY